jgi:hypothetical protein
MDLVSRATSQLKINSDTTHHSHSSNKSNDSSESESEVEAKKILTPFMLLKQLKNPTFTKHERREQKKIKLQAVQFLIDNI